jgi:hypothetical protein
MKKAFFFTSLILIIHAVSFSQSVRVASAFDGFILSFSKVDIAGASISTKPRFTCFLHLGFTVHVEFSKNVGIYSGLGIKNIGFITENTVAGVPVMKKRRSYNLCLPLGLKIGAFHKSIALFGGGTIELPFHYKEKYFENGDKKSKFTEWFSNRTPLYMYSAFGGIEFPLGFYVKFQYYFSNFLNKNYSGDGITYANFDARVFYISFGFNFYNKKYKGDKSTLKNTLSPKEALRTI